MGKADGLGAQAEVLHVLFLDIVGVSTLDSSARTKYVSELNRAVSDTPTYSAARQKGSVTAFSSGDGLVLLYDGDVAAAAKSAVETWGAVQGLPFQLRMGIHSGLVQRRTDIMGNPNLAGEGINTAQRVMELADPGHILLSEQYANWLSQSEEWRPFVFEVGEGSATHGPKVKVCNLVSDRYGNRTRPAALASSTADGSSLQIVILYRRQAKPDDRVVELLEAHFRALGHSVFIDRHLKIGVEWAKAIEGRIRSADAVIAVLSDAAVGSEMVEFELETSLEEFRQRGKPFVFPVRVGADEPLGGSLGGLVNSLQFIPWHGPEDDQRVLDALSQALRNPNHEEETDYFEPVGGAVPEGSKFYVERKSDQIFLNAIRSNESIILVKGPRQIGKTSLIGRGVSLVDELGWRTVTTDFQKLSGSQLAVEESFYRMLALSIARQLGFKYDWESEWISAFGCNMNMDSFLRAALEDSDRPLVWFMDEADRIFGIPFASDFFGLVRSWHNSRAMERRGPWGRFTLVIGYATEAHLFIQDLNQSPFNVGLQLPLQFFDVEQTKEINRRYGSPVTSSAHIAALHALVGGQPFLTRRAFDVLARREMDFDRLMNTADRDDGPFGDHLKRILLSVSQMPGVLETMRQSLTNPELRETDGFHRLVSAGVMVQTADRKVAFRTDLYRRYLAGHLS